MVNLRRNFIFKDISARNFVNLTEAEKEIVRNWRNDKKINKWLFDNHIISRQEHKNFIEKLKGNNKDFYWLVKKKRGSYIGVVYLNRVNFKDKNAYLGVYANPSFTGVGYILMRCLKELAFGVAHLHTLKLEVLENNVRAIRLYLRQGFREEGKLKDFVLKTRKWKDAIVMGELNRNAKKD